MVAYVNERTLLSIPVQPKLAKAIKQYVLDSKIEDRKATMNDFYDNCVLWFLEESKKNPELIYLMSLRKGNTYRSVWLNSQLYNKVRTIARRDNVSINRVVYSAIDHFLAAAEYI